MRVGVLQLEQVSSTLDVMSFFTLSIRMIKNIDVWRQLYACDIICFLKYMIIMFFLTSIHWNFSVFKSGLEL